MADCDITYPVDTLEVSFHVPEIDYTELSLRLFVFIFSQMHKNIFLELQLIQIDSLLEEDQIFIVQTTFMKSGSRISLFKTL